MRALAGGVVTIVLALSVAAQNAPPESLGSGVLAYYPFDVNAEDQSGNGNAATASTGVVYVPGIIGEAAAFRAADATLSLPDMGRYAASYSLATWVNWSSGSAAPNVPRRIVSQLNLEPATGTLQFLFYYDSQTNTENASATFRSNRAVAPDGWHHVAVVYDGAAGKLQFYIDGVADGADATPPGVRARLPWFTATQPAGNAGGAFLNGAIDEVLIYNRALTAAEVQYLTTVRAGAVDQTSTPARSSKSSCGKAGQYPCRRCTEHFWWPPLQWGECRVDEAYCKKPNQLVDANTPCVAPQSPCETTDRSAAPNDDCVAPGPVFTVAALPDTIDIDGGPLLTGIVGWKAEIKNAPGATYFVPDSRQLAVDCGRLSAWIQATCTGSTSTQCQSLRTLSRSCNSQPPTCTRTNIVADARHALNYPLYTLQEWHNIYPSRLKVNANWFDVNGPPGFPYISPCTDIYGWSVSDGVQVSSATNGNPIDVSGKTELLDALVVMETPSSGHDELRHGGGTARSLRIVGNSEISSLKYVKQAIGGFILVKGGKIVNTFPASTKPSGNGARTAIGLDKERQTLFVVVVQAGPGARGMTALDLATYMRAKLKAYDVINLDNSGSSQFYYDDGKTVYISLPGDWNLAHQRVWRPVANFFAIE